MIFSNLKKINLNYFKKCPNCHNWLNRPVQVDCVVIEKGKILLLRKDLQKELSRKDIQESRLKYLKKKFKNKKYYYVLPGHAIRKAESVEEAARRILLEEACTLGKIKGVVGVYSSHERDHRSFGVSIGIRFTLNDYISNKPLGAKNFLLVWRNVKNLPKDLAWDHLQIANDGINGIDLGKNLLKNIDSSIGVYDRRLKRVDDRLLCKVCGQFDTRPAQVDVLVIKGKEVLLIKRKIPKGISKREYTPAYYDNFYALPGGYVKVNQNLDDALKAELYEETGLLPLKFKLVGIYSNLDRDPKSSGVSFAFQCDKFKGKIRGSKETESVNWVSMDELPENIAYDHREMIEDIRNRLG